MTTFRDIIERAYREIRVVAADEAMTAEQAANGLVTCNSMMHGWKLFGANIGHADAQLTDTFTLPPRFEEGTVFMLASRLGSAYATQPGFDADKWMRALQAAYANPPASEMPYGFRFPPSRSRWRA